MSETYQSHVAASTPGVGGLIPFFGVPCFLVSLYTDYPACFGGVSIATCCCVSLQNAFWKPTKRGNSYMVCTSNECEFLHFEPVLKSKTQWFCIDTKFSFPPDENNPCLVTVCFCTIIYNNQLSLAFFKKVSELGSYRAIPSFAR